MKNIFALTSPGISMPGFISLNACPQSGLSLSVRSDKSGQGAVMKLELLQLQDMHAAIGKYLAEIVPATAKSSRVKTPSDLPTPPAAEKTGNL